MNIPPIKLQSPLGILRGYNKTPYGDYMWGVSRNRKIEVFNARKYDQKLIYISELPTLKCVKYKFTYKQNNVKRVVRSESNISSILY